MVRKTKYKHNKIVTLPQDNTKEVSKDEWNDSHDEVGMTGHGVVSTIVISSGAITPVNDMHIIDGEGAASDNLDNIINTETAEFDEILLYSGAQIITVKNGIGNIFTLSEIDIVLSSTIATKFIRKGTDWFETGSVSEASTDLIFGNGSDGSATNPALVGGDYKQFTNLTIDANTEWSGVGDIIVRVSGILNIEPGFTLTLSNLADSKGDGGLGGIAVEGGGDGGDGGDSKGMVLIIANTVIGTGTITSTGLDGIDGTNGAGAGTSNGLPGENPSTVQLLGSIDAGLIPEGGEAGTTDIVGSPDSIGGDTGTDWGIDTLAPLITSVFLTTITHSAGGAGGGSGASRNNTQGLTGGGAGQGAGSPLAKGGKGGDGIRTNVLAGSSGGAGGGGGHPCLLILITKTITALNIILTGGDGGDGGTGDTSGGAGGGGSGVGWLLVAAVDNTVKTLTGGAPGIGALNATNGIIGTTRTVFETFADFQIILNMKI